MKLSFVFACLASILIALIAWPIGGNYPHVRTATIAVGLIMVLLALLTQFSGKPLIDGSRDLRQQSFSWIWILIALGAGYSALQVVPGIADRPGDIIATNNIATANVVTSNTGGTISAYPAASKGRLAELLGAVAIFLASFCLLRSRAHITTVFVAALITGTVVGFVGVLQKLGGNGKVLWVYELLQGGVPFGPFVNKNSAGGFLLACFSGAVFVLALQLFNWKSFQEDQSANGRKKKQSLWRRITGFVAGLKTQHLYTFAALAFIGFAVVATLSRGATIALAGASVVTLVFLGTVNRWALAVGLLAATAGVGLAFYAEQSDAVSQRIETLADVSEAAAPRMLHWQESMPYVRENLIAGSGLGTHKYMYLADQQRHYNKWFQHAENVYLETLGELGIGGLTILMLVLALCIHASWRLFHSPNRFDKALGVAGMCLLWGQIISSFLDFGIYSAANFAVVGILLGAVTGRAATIPRRQPSDDSQTELPSGSSAGTTNQPPGKSGFVVARIFRAVILLAVGAGCVWAIRESHGVECTRHAKRLITQYKRSSGNDVAKLDRAGWLLERATKIRPDDSETNYQAGEYHVARYRQATIKLIIATEKPEPETPEPETPESDAEPMTVEEAWPATSLPTLHRLAHMARRDSQGEYAALIDEPAIREHLHEAWKFFLQAEQSCHSLAKTQFSLAELSIVMENGISEKSRIAEAIRRSPANSQILYDCGVLSLNAGDLAETSRLWHQCLSYSRVYEEQIVQFARRELPMKMFFEDVLPADPEELLRISRKYFGLPEQTLPKRLLLVHTKRLIEKSDLPAAEKFFLVAETQQLSDNPVAAAGYYALALDGDEIRVEWRYKYAQTLHVLKRYDEAIEQLTICGRRPSRLQAQIARLITRIQRDRKSQSPLENS